MLTDKIPEDQTNLTVIRQPVEIILSEDSASPLSLIGPPIEDLSEIEWLSDKNFSVKELYEGGSGEREEVFSWELKKLQRKRERFAHSPVYFNHLANLAAVAGDLDLEADYLGLASNISNDLFFAHRKADNLIARHRLSEAEAAFGKLDLSKDIYANLRLASLLVTKHELNAAVEYVERAVSLDPTDYAARLFEGALRLVQRNYEAAAHSFRLAASDRPTSSVAQSNLAVAYVRLNLPEKALGALRRAVALNPLNANAVMMLADLAHKLERNEDAVPSLRYFVEFEQKNSALWARLARALLTIGRIDESIAALKRQGSIDKSSSVWNNLGVAYHHKREFGQSLAAFKYAMNLDASNKGRNFFLAARNTAVTFSQNREVSELLSFTRMVLTADSENLIIRDRELSDLIALHIHALSRNDDIETAIGLSESILKRSDAVHQLRIWVATGLLALYGVRIGAEEKALSLATEFKNWIDEIAPQDTHLKERLLNNIVFVFAEMGKIEEAEKWFSQISHLVHKDPYPTSVLGLIHFRKGHIERGTELYEEAIHIASKKIDKLRIRQKLNLEIAASLSLSDPLRSARFFRRVYDLKDGDRELARRARLMLERLPAVGTLK